MDSEISPVVGIVGIDDEKSAFGLTFLIVPRVECIIGVVRALYKVRARTIASINGSEASLMSRVEIIGVITSYVPSHPRIRSTRHLEGRGGASWHINVVQHIPGSVSVFVSTFEDVREGVLLVEVILRIFCAA